MGNHRFRFSDMMPNAWFHKLKVMARPSRSPTGTKSAHSATPAAGGPSTPKLLPPPPPYPAEPPYLQPRRASYYFSSRQEKAAPAPASPAHPRASDTLFPVHPPRKSKKRARRKQPRPSHRLVSSVSAGGGWSCRATLDSDDRAAEALDGPARVKLEDHRAGGEDGDGVNPCFDKLIIAECYDDRDGGVAASCRPPSCNWNGVSPAHDHDVVVMDVASNGGSAAAKFEELDLPPIITKPSEKEPEKPSKLAGGGRNASSKGATNKNSHKQGSLSPIPAIPKVTQKGSRFQRRPPPTPPATPGIRMRAASPRLASKTKVIRAQRSRKAAPPRGCLYSESFAVVKSSADPQRDFRDSMMEMIAENNIRRSRDLEDLLACYLSLNSDQYHDVIVKVFEQIWFDLTDVSCRESCP